MNILNKLSIVPMILGLCMTASLAHAQQNPEGAARQNMSAEQQEAAQQKWESMTPEEQQAYKAKRTKQKEHWDSMSPEAKQAYKAKRTKQKEHWDSMSPEEQQAYKNKRAQGKE